jgi:hypothetical protein
VWQNSLHNRETTGKLLGNSSSLTKIRPENICEFSSVPVSRTDFPVQRNRELIRPQQGIRFSATAN